MHMFEEHKIKTSVPVTTLKRQPVTNWLDFWSKHDPCANIEIKMDYDEGPVDGNRDHDLILDPL